MKLTLETIAFWAKAKDYSLEDAACLVCDQQPGTVKHDDPEYRMVSHIQEILKDDRCYKSVETDFIPNRDWQGCLTGSNRALGSKKSVSRELLAEWCKANGYSPLILSSEKPSNQAATQDEKRLTEKERQALLNIIGALLSVIEGDCPSLGKHQDFKSRASLIKVLDEKYKGYIGLSKRNLEEKLPYAKQNLSES